MHVLQFILIIDPFWGKFNSLRKTLDLKYDDFFQTLYY